jgi:N-acetylglucosamine-6-sulfatase
MGLRRTLRLLASLGTAVLLASVVVLVAVIGSVRAQTTPTRPNMMFILTDDMRKGDLAYMPKTRSLLGGRGMTFRNAFVSNALCAPSRASIMRGQYSHNNGVWSNSSTDSPSTATGGWQAYQQNGNEADNVATRLDDAGYRTALFGKYMNRYANTTDAPPPGWDRWFAAATLGDPKYFDYDVNDNGTPKHFGTSDRDYMTDVLSRKTEAFISSSVSQGTPFFAYVAPIAPHAPATPARRDVHAYDGVNGPRLPSFDEEAVSDKPPWIRQLPKLTSSQIAAIDERHEKRVESLQAVDDLVEGVVRTLRDTGALGNTYVIFTSDNGFHHGEHRIPQQKWRPYEEDVHMPLLVRGPRVAAGSTTSKLTLDTDYLPTFTNLAGAQTPSYVDGRSLEPVLRGSVTSWRSAVLLEAAANYSPAYRGIRTISNGTTTKRKYVEYSGDAKDEIYNLASDPYELTNRYDPGAAPPAGLDSRLQVLKSCRAGAAVPVVTCQAAEDGQ